MSYHDVISALQMVLLSRGYFPLSVDERLYRLHILFMRGLKCMDYGLYFWRSNLWLHSVSITGKMYEHSSH